jgi:diguanylate cyclase (GGDEF)-like protein/PAS domain S-box-containing protein
MKHYEARPRLVALATFAAAFAIWCDRDVVVSLAPLDVAVPLPWLLIPVVVAGVLGLIAPLMWQRHHHESRRRDIIPTLLHDPSHANGALEAASAVAAVGTDPAAAAAQRDPEAASARTQRELVVELDGQSRIVQCVGAGAMALAADPASLTGASLLELVPARVRSVVVDAVRSARAAPGEAIALPKLRLQMHNSGNPPQATDPVELTFTARADGTLCIHGQAADPKPAAAPQMGASDDRFSRIFHSSPDAILIIRFRDGTLIDFNASFTRLLGYSREQAIGRRTADLDLWVDVKVRQGLIATFRKRRTITDAEVQLKSAAGGAVPVELSLRFIELDGELCVLCVARDISKRLEAELAARSSAEKFTQVFTQSPDGVLILRSSDLTICDVNPAFVRGSGFPADELVGHPLSVLESIADARDLQQMIETLSRQGWLASLEMRLRSRKGRDVTALVSGTATEIDGEPSLLCIIKDVTELRHAQEQLRRSEERFRGAFENAPIGIMLLDPQGHIFQANRFATELLHYPDRSLDTVHVSRLVPSDERGDLKEQLERLVRGSKAALASETTLGSETTLRSERRMLCADGLEIWTNCHIVLQHGADGEPLYSIMQIADITEMKTSQRHMERLAFYDTLTELANRRLFNDRLQQAVEHCRRHDLRAALLYLDLDQFKRVNDTLGHESGDALLKEVAGRLLGCVRKEDTVGRPGGDEFTILLYDVDTASHAGKVAEKILRALERPVTISGHQLVVTTSIGITVIPDDGVDPNALTKNADLAMYRAKEKGRNNYQFYSEELNTNAVHRLRTEHELRRALERSEFELYFQPTIRLSDQSIVGVECLLRWNHPERGIVAPDDFIEIAEETGAIVEIGNWVIEEACAAGRLIAEQHGAPLSIAVNISPRQFRDPHLVSTIRQSLRRAHLDPGLLEVEITETMLMEDVEAALEIVQRLHKLGIRLAIDDFGTGYSSLNHLKKFPIDTVKVDRTFVTDIPESSDDMEITAAVIAMAHRLRMQVVAEGVETQAQLAFLTEQKCDFAQGFLFSRAMPLKDITRMLSADVGLLHTGG